MDINSDTLNILREVFDPLPLVFVGLDSQGLIKFWNHGAEEITGYSRAEVENNPEILKSFFPNPEVLKDVYVKINSGQSFAGQVYPSVNKDGTPKFFSYYNTGLELDVMGVQNWVIGIDVTEEKRQEEELRKRIHDIEEIVQTLNDKDIELNNLIEESKSQTNENSALD